MRCRVHLGRDKIELQTNIDDSAQIRFRRFAQREIARPSMEDSSQRREISDAARVLHDVHAMDSPCRADLDPMLVGVMYARL
jgi:hypothetical protein